MHVKDFSEKVLLTLSHQAVLNLGKYLNSAKPLFSFGLTCQNVCTTFVCNTCDLIMCNLSFYAVICLTD